MNNPLSGPKYQSTLRVCNWAYFVEKLFLFRVVIIDSVFLLILEIECDDGFEERVSVGSILRVLP